MAKTNKFKASVFFQDADGIERFLFRIINYGKSTDELKFISIHPNSQQFNIYSEDDNLDFEQTEMRKHCEISYHSDGSLLWKLPNTKDGQPKIIDNANDTGDRRTPIAKIRVWEPVIIGNIIKYGDCTTGLTDDARIIPANKHVFNGEPFEFCVMLGSMICADPPNSSDHELLFRVNDIAEKIDMIVWIYKSDYHGKYGQVGDTPILITGNIIRIAERRIQINNGVIEINLDMLQNPFWNENIVDEYYKLNLHALRNQQPLTFLCKVYLKHNPYLRQLTDFVGFNKDFAMSALFDRKPLGVPLAGVLDKDDEGDFFSFGIPPDQ